MTKYRVGRKLGTVILTVDGTKEIAHCTSKEIAQEICILLNGTKPVNVDLADITCKCVTKINTDGNWTIETCNHCR